MFALVWSVGACVDTDSRVKFDAFFKDLVAGKIEEHAIPSLVGKIEAPIPNEGLVYDYLFEVWDINEGDVMYLFSSISPPQWFFSHHEAFFVIIGHKRCTHFYLAIENLIELGFFVSLA